MRLPAGNAFFIVSLWALSGADLPEPAWVALNHTAHQALEAKDYPKLRDALAKLQLFLPGNPQITYNLAIADAHLGEPQRALSELRDLTAAGLVYDFNADENFASLRGSPGFTALLRQVDRNKKIVASASPVATLPERDLLPEDIACDPKTSRFFVGSVTMCKIVTAEGALFAKADWPVMALRVDAQRRTLWAAIGWHANCRQCNPADHDKTALVAFDLDSGAVLRRVESPVKGLLADMTISREGDLYISEGSYGAIFRLRAKSETLERLDAPGDFPSPQTPALSSDEQTLFVPDYERGIAAMDLKTHTVRWLQPAHGIVLSGIDGFYRYGNTFLAVQNGVTPARLVLFSADFTKQEVLEANSPGLGVPTHGTLVGAGFYFLANTGWDVYDDDGKKKRDRASVESQIRKIVLGKR
jgi:hypothetical protein